MIRQEQLAFQQLRLLSSRVCDLADDVAADTYVFGEVAEKLYELRELVEQYDREAKELFLSGRGREVVPPAKEVNRG